MNVLFSSDLHLGRTPSKLPPSWRSPCRTIRIWERLVDQALQQKVDALLIGGDMLDASNRYWEALAPLQRGADRLAEAGIPLVAVAGNHDAEILPRIADRLGPERMTLLGRNGRWESITLSSNGSPACQLWGWSFPGTHYDKDPTLKFPATKGDLPVLAMVHGDLGASQSRYAPLSLNRMRGLPPQAWLLGHLHNPALHSDLPWVLMPGSPQPLDPSETGAHSAWRVEIRGGIVQPPVPIPIATLQYDRVHLSFDTPDSCTEERLQDAVLGNLPDHPAEFLHLRIRLETPFATPDDFRRMLTHFHEWRPSETLCLAPIELAVSRPFDRAALQAAHPALRHLGELMEQPDRIPADLRGHLEEIVRNISGSPLFSGLPSGSSPLEYMHELLDSLAGKLGEELEVSRGGGLPVCHPDPPHVLDKETKNSKLTL